MKASVVRGSQEKVLLRRCGRGDLVRECRDAHGCQPAVLCGLGVILGFLLSQVLIFCGQQVYYTGAEVEMTYIPANIPTRWNLREWDTNPSVDQSPWSGPSDVQDSLLLAGMLNVVHQRLMEEIQQEGFIVVEGPGEPRDADGSSQQAWDRTLDFVQAPAGGPLLLQDFGGLSLQGAEVAGAQGPPFELLRDFMVLLRPLGSTSDQGTGQVQETYDGPREVQVEMAAVDSIEANTAKNVAFVPEVQSQLAVQAGSTADQEQDEFTELDLITDRNDLSDSLVALDQDSSQPDRDAQMSNLAKGPDEGISWETFQSWLEQE